MTYLLEFHHSTHSMLSPTFISCLWIPVLNQETCPSCLIKRKINSFYPVTLVKLCRDQVFPFTQLSNSSRECSVFATSISDLPLNFLSTYFLKQFIMIYFKHRKSVADNTTFEMLKFFLLLFFVVKYDIKFHVNH